MRASSAPLKALKAAFPFTIPIMTGFLFLGMSYGIYAVDAGLPAFFPTLTSVVVFGGSLEFVLVPLLTGAFQPVGAFMMALMIQARHLFYGLTMLGRYRGMGKKKPYLIFGLCDETFSINFTARIPEGVDRGWFMFFVTLLNQFYWFSGSTLGGLAGSLLHFNTEGLDFVMTAMFVVIFMEQWMKEKRHITAVIGLGASFICLILFGADSFMIPTMACIPVLPAVLKKPIEKAGGFERK